MVLYSSSPIFYYEYVLTYKFLSINFDASLVRKSIHSHTHTHTYIYIFFDTLPSISIYTFMAKKNKGKHPKFDHLVNTS